MEFDWVYLATTVGAAAMTVIITQVIKAIVGTEINTWWLRLIVFCLGAAILIVSNIVIYGFTWANFGLCALNSIVVYLIATGAYTTSKITNSDT